MMPYKSNYYADAEPSETTAPETETESPAAEAEEGGETAELPKSVLGGKEFKPGEEVVLQVVQVMENSVLVKYASEDEQTEEAPPEEAPAPAPAGNPMYQ